MPNITGTIPTQRNSGTKTIIADNWYESFFTGINCEMWQKAETKEMTDNEVKFLTELFDLPKGSRLLDLPCGTGRHSIELAKLGYQLTSIDISEEFITSLEQAIKEQHLDVEAIHANILTHELTGSFDGAFCIGNSFGYFPYEGMQVFIKKVSAVLKPGAKWIINTGLVAESFLAKFITEKTYELDGLTMQINNDYDEWNSCLITTLTYTKNDRQEIHHFKHYVYTVAEIIRLLSNHHLKTIALYSATDKTEYQLGGPQLYLVAEKLADPV